MKLSLKKQKRRQGESPKEHAFGDVGEPYVESQKELRKATQAKAKWLESTSRRSASREGECRHRPRGCCDPVYMEQSGPLVGLQIYVVCTPHYIK